MTNNNFIGGFRRMPAPFTPRSSTPHLNNNTDGNACDIISILPPPAAYIAPTTMVVHPYTPYEKLEARRAIEMIAKGGGDFNSYVVSTEFRPVDGCFSKR